MIINKIALMQHGLTDSQHWRKPFFEGGSSFVLIKL